MRLEQWLQGTLRAAIFLTTCGNLFYSDELIIFPASKVSKVSFSLIFLASRTLLMCVSVCQNIWHLYMQCQEKDFGSPGTGARDDCQLPYGY